MDDLGQVPLQAFAEAFPVHREMLAALAWCGGPPLEMTLAHSWAWLAARLQEQIDACADPAQRGLREVLVGRADALGCAVTTFYRQESGERETA